MQPGVTPVVEYPAEVMRSLPVYHLISKKADVEDCTWLQIPVRRQRLLAGTARSSTTARSTTTSATAARGGVWRYSMGKNMWKFDFNRGHYFQARDDYGNPYDTTWDKLNFSACIQQGNFGQRGEQGMFEALSFRLFNLAGCPASKTNYVHFRIIDEAYEDGTRNAAHPPLTASGTQYDGDFWGLYLTIEQMDGRFLDEHDLPDGNLYKMDRTARPTGSEQPGADAAVQRVRPQPVPAAIAAAAGALVAAERQPRRLLRLLRRLPGHPPRRHHAARTGSSITTPRPNQWWQLPWDLDLTWTTYYGSNDPSDPFSRAGVSQHQPASASRTRTACGRSSTCSSTPTRRTS